MPPGTSALELGIDPQAMQAASLTRQNTAGQAATVAERPSAEVGGPPSAPAQPPAAAPLGAQAPAPPSPAKYDPMKALEKHLLNLHPDLEQEHLDLAKNYLRAKMQVASLKHADKELRAHATEHHSTLMKLHAADLEREKIKEELSQMMDVYNAEADKYPKGVEPPGLTHPRKDLAFGARVTKADAAFKTHQAESLASGKKYRDYYKKATGRDMQKGDEFDPMAIRLMMLGDKQDPTEDMVDEHYRSK